jgi:hypothetical protein
MRRILLVGATLLFLGALTVRSKNDPLVFIFLRVDADQQVAILRPMIAPDIGVNLDSAQKTLKQGTLLRCAALTQEHSAIVEGQRARVSELMLDCGQHKFIVKGLDFSPRTK